MALYVRARVRREMNDRSGADLDLERAIAVDPMAYEARLERGWAVVERDPRTALADFDEVLAFEPRDVAALRGSLDEDAGAVERFLARENDDPHRLLLPPRRWIIVPTGSAATRPRGTSR